MCPCEAFVPSGDCLSHSPFLFTLAFERQAEELSDLVAHENAHGYIQKSHRIDMRTESPCNMKSACSIRNLGSPQCGLRDMKMRTSRACRECFIGLRLQTGIFIGRLCLFVDRSAF